MLTPNSPYEIGQSIYFGIDVMYAYMSPSGHSERTKWHELDGTIIEMEYCHDRWCYTVSGHDGDDYTISEDDIISSDFSGTTLDKHIIDLSII